MNVLAILATAFATIFTVAAEPCNLLALAPIASAPAASKCTADSGLQLLPPQLPTADQVPKLCASSACKSLLAELKKAAPKECTIAISTPPLELYAQLLTPLEKACETPVATTAAPTAGPPAAPATTTPVGTPATPVATTATPVGTTQAPPETPAPIATQAPPETPAPIATPAPTNLQC